nr:hypothetical protein [uncultured Cohaesibacter sp.]
MLLYSFEILSNYDVLPWFDKKQFKPPKTDKAPISPSDVKMVNWHQIVALADAFKRLEPNDSAYQSNQDFDYLRVNVMMANLLATHPCRVSELWRLPSDCEIIAAPVEKYGPQITEDQHDNLDFKYGLVWFPVKGGKAVVKPIPSAVQWVAHRCIEIIRSYGIEARKTAAFIVENPGVIPIPDHLSHIKATDKISETDIRLLLGLPNERTLNEHNFWKSNFKKTWKNRTKIHNSDNLYCFETFQTEWWETFQKEFKKTFKNEWPYVVNHKGYQLRADNALLLFYRNRLESRTQLYSPVFFDTISSSTLDLILSDGQPLVKTIWERLDITLPNGSYPDINTHDLRHFLNTIAQQAGLSEPIIAMWSGRKSLSQNAAYDHRTDEERLAVHGYEVEDYDGLQSDDILALQAQKAYQTVTIAPPSKQVLDPDQQVLETMKNKSMISISPFGYCIGSLIQEPCAMAVNCLSCDRYFVCKGSKKSLDYITSKIKSLENQLGSLEELKKKNSRLLRNPNLIPLIEKQLKGAKALQADLNDPKIPDGNLIARGDYQCTTSPKLSDRVSAFRTQMKQMQSSKKELTGE